MNESMASQLGYQTPDSTALHTDNFRRTGLFFVTRLSALIIASLIAGCATDPVKLAAPAQLTCIYLSEPLAFSAKYGALDVVWNIRLERGPYLSEREDDKGTYYRAPPGGVFAGRPDMRDMPSGILSHLNRDGGLWIPKDPASMPRLYYYVTYADVPAEVAPPEMNCSSFSQIKDPATSKLSLVAGAAGGAAGALVGRATLSGTSLNTVSYGQAALGGAIAGGILTAIANSEIGKFTSGHEIKDDQFISKIRELSQQAVSITVISRGEISGNP